MLRRSISVALAGLIVFNFGSPLSLVAGAAEPGAAAPAATGGLALASDPLGADVYVDGVLAGQTPVTLNAPAGDHRVRFVKDGYLENARVVSVAAARPTSVQIKLTRQVGSQAARAGQVQVAVGSAPSGGGSKLPFLLLGLGGGFAGGYLYQKSKTSDAPAAVANRAPVVGSVAASPAIGLMASTVISLSAASPSDADGDALTFDWDFGDGSPHSTSATPTHTYATAGTFPAKVTIGDGKGGAVTSAATNVVIKSLAGTWNGPLSSNQVYNASLVLTQVGANIPISSTYSDQFANSGTILGSVTAGGTVTMSVTVGSSAPFSFTGTLSADFNTITGTANGSGFTNAAWVLARQ